MKKLIKCKACEMEISRTAEACPHCGELSTASKIDKVGKGLIGLGCALMILIPIAIAVIIFLIGVFQQ